jgi:superfamily II DNA or RNA helicase
MSIRIRKSDLKNREIDLIKSMLVFSAELTPFEKFGPNAQYVEAPKQIMFYRREGEHIYVPFNFCIEYLPKLITDMKWYECDLGFSGELFQHQKEVVEELSPHLIEHQTTTLNLYTGAGKTVLSTYITCITGCKAVILCNRTILLKQWRSAYEKYTDARIHVVDCSDVIIDSEIHDIEELQKMISKKDKIIDIQNYDVLICLDERYHCISKEVKERIGCLIIDEGHLFCTPSRVDCLLSFTPKFIIVATATLQRDDGLHKMIHFMVGKHAVIRHSQKPFSIIKMNTGFIPITQKNSRGTDYKAYTDSIIQSKERNQLIVNLIKSNSQFKTLVLSSRKDHISSLRKKLIEEEGIECDFLAGTKNSYSDSNVLLGTMSKIGVGFDEEGACENFGGKRIELVIITTSIKKSSVLEQNVGRGFRSEFPMVIHLVDNHAIAKRHFRDNKKWYCSRKGIIIEKNVEDDD